MLLYLGRKREAVNTCSYIWEEKERLLIHAHISRKKERLLMYALISGKKKRGCYSACQHKCPFFQCFCS